MKTTTKHRVGAAMIFAPLALMLVATVARAAELAPKASAAVALIALWFIVGIRLMVSE